jgi:hypothetical protein
MEHNLDLLNADGLDESISNTNGGFRFGNLRARLNRMNRPVRVIARRGDGDFSDANGYEDVNLKNLDLSANGMNLQDLDLGANGDYSYCCGVDGDDSNANGFRFGNLRARLNRRKRPIIVRRGDGEINSDADGEGYSYITVTPEQAKMAADVGGKLLANIKRKPKTELESNLKAACGRKPLFGKSKKKKYQECATKFMANAEKSKSAAAEAIARGKEAEARTAEANAAAKAAEAKTSENSRLAAPASDKFLGMPKAVGITVVAVGGLALLVGGYFLIKKMRK